MNSDPEQLADVSGSHSEASALELIFAKLKRLEADVDAAYDTAPFGSHTLNADGTFASVNAMGLSWLECTREQVVGLKSPTDFLAEVGRAEREHQILRLGRGSSAGLDVTVRNGRGKSRPVSESFSARPGDLPGDSKRAIYFDQSEIRKTQEAQRISAMAFESMAGMCITDIKGFILRVNGAFSILTGYTAADVIGKNMHLLSAGLHDQAFYTDMWETLKTNGRWQGEVRNRKKDGTHFFEWLSIGEVLGADGKVSNYVGTFYDITDVKRDQLELSRMANTDALTQLPNRRLMLEHAAHALSIYKRSGLRSALLYIDLDNFKAINDTRGHQAGDLLLIEVAARMRSGLRDSDVLGRLGGDEFVVLIEAGESSVVECGARATEVARKLIQVLSAPYLIDGSEFRCTASIGVSLMDACGSADEVLVQADLAMYQAKKSGRNRFQFFDPQIQTALTARVKIEQDLHRAIEQHEFVLHYQAQVDSTGKTVAAEALIRWNHPRDGMIGPFAFIASAEDLGLILPIGQWVLETACQQLKVWESSATTSELSLSVNVSARQFAQPDFVASVQQALSAAGAKPGLLVLEITESMVLDVEDAIQKINSLKHLGVRFSMDDFGTGYSSLSSLTRLPIDELKIDQSFVRNMGKSVFDKVVVQTILGMATNLGLSVVAEGVETPEQWEQLKAMGCPYFQGFLFQKPMPIDVFNTHFCGAATPG